MSRFDYNAFARIVGSEAAAKLAGNRDGRWVEVDTTSQAYRDAIKNRPATPVPVRKKAPPRLRCRSLGEDTGLTVPCASCSGKVKLKLYVCGVHKVCTVGKRVAGVASCVGCQQYAAQ